MKYFIEYTAIAPRVAYVNYDVDSMEYYMPSTKAKTYRLLATRKLLILFKNGKPKYQLLQFNPKIKTK
jgi:hypothetical protein